MKKFLAILLVVAFAAGFAACANNAADKPDADVKGEGVMTHASSCGSNAVNTVVATFAVLMLCV